MVQIECDPNSGTTVIESFANPIFSPGFAVSFVVGFLFLCEVDGKLLEGFHIRLCFELCEN
jgi:hypothetical protein